MPTSAGRTRGRSPREAHAAIERFLKASRQPALLEPGEDHYVLEPGSYVIEWTGERLSINVWDKTRNLSRRVIGVHQEKPGRLELIIEKFMKREGRLYLLDLARPGLAGFSLRERRLSLREEFRRMLARELPEWKIAELSTEQDLEHSLSRVYPRALLRKGQSALAALATSPDAAEGALTYGLIWLDYLRRREPKLTLEGLALFLPVEQARTTCLRLRWLHPDAARWLPYVYSEEGFVEPVDMRDYGNLDTRIEPAPDPAAMLSNRVAEWTERLARLPEVERIPRAGGAVSLRVRGLEFARSQGDVLHFGLAQRTAADERSLPEIEELARELVRLRSARGSSMYRLQPESWLESQIRSHLEQVDAALLPSPVYGQVPAFAGGERGVLDLLAVERTGRLVVLELKASEDIHLPLQALDYWLRVQWHLERGEFSGRGYFPGIEIRNEPPRLLLIAPALDFHPTTEMILRYFSPQIQVERIGLGVEWRSNLKVVFRALGAHNVDASFRPDPDIDSTGQSRQGA